MKKLIIVILLYINIQSTLSDFQYVDFNTTLGISFNGVATTSSCDVDEEVHLH